MRAPRVFAVAAPRWTPPSCADGPRAHPPAFALQQRRPCGHRSRDVVLVCADHARSRRERADPPATRCEQCGEAGPLVVDRVTDIAVHRLVTVVRGLDYDRREVRDRQVREWYDQHVRRLRRMAAAEPVEAGGPLETWELLPEAWPGRGRVAPYWRCAFSVVTCDAAPS